MEVEVQDTGNEMGGKDMGWMEHSEGAWKGSNVILAEN